MVSSTASNAKGRIVEIRICTFRMNERRILSRRRAAQ